MTHFREVQKFRQAWLWLILLAPMGFVGWGAYQQFVLRRPWGDRPMPDTGLLVFCGAMALFLVWFFVLRLVTEVRDNEVTVQFVPMWRKRTIALAQIRGAESVQYRPIRDYGGWGIRRGLTGWAYNVSGNRGVLLKFFGGTDVLIGSQRPEELAAVIEERRKVMPSGR